MKISVYVTLVGAIWVLFCHICQCPLSLVWDVSGALRCYTQILDSPGQKLPLFPHIPRQRILSGSRMHTTKVLPEVAECCWCSVGVSSGSVLRLIWKWHDFEAGITDASAECATLKVKHNNFLSPVFWMVQLSFILQAGLFNFHWIILMEWQWDIAISEHHWDLANEGSCKVF